MCMVNDEVDEGGRRMINYTIPVMFRWLDWSKV